MNIRLLTNHGTTNRSDRRSRGSRISHPKQILGEVWGRAKDSHNPTWYPVKRYLTKDAQITVICGVNPKIYQGRTELVYRGRFMDGMYFLEDSTGKEKLRLNGALSGGNCQGAEGFAWIKFKWDL